MNSKCMVWNLFKSHVTCKSWRLYILLVIRNCVIYWAGLELHDTVLSIHGTKVVIRTMFMVARFPYYVFNLLRIRLRNQTVFLALLISCKCFSVQWKVSCLSEISMYKVCESETRYWKFRKIKMRYIFGSKKKARLP